MANEQNRRIYIHDIGDSLTEEDLKEAFEHFGSVDEASIQRDRETRRSRGFGFVTFSTSAAARDAVNKAELDVKDRNVKIEYAKAKDDRKGGAERVAALTGARSDICYDFLDNDCFRSNCKFSHDIDTGRRGSGRDAPSDRRDRHYDSHHSGHSSFRDGPPRGDIGDSRGGLLRIPGSRDTRYSQYDERMDGYVREGGYRDRVPGGGGFGRESGYRDKDSDRRAGYSERSNSIDSRGGRDRSNSDDERALGYSSKYADQALNGSRADDYRPTSGYQGYSYMDRSESTSGSYRDRGPAGVDSVYAETRAPQYSSSLPRVPLSGSDGWYPDNSYSVASSSSATYRPRYSDQDPLGDQAPLPTSSAYYAPSRSDPSLAPRASAYGSRASAGYTDSYDPGWPASSTMAAPRSSADGHGQPQAYEQQRYY